jgi:hypothetical protein
MHSYSDWTQVFFFDANKRKVVRSVSCPGECRCVLFLPAGRFSVVSFPSEAAVPPGLIQQCCATSAIHCVSSAVCLGCWCRVSECSRVVPAVRICRSFECISDAQLGCLFAGWTSSSCRPGKWTGAKPSKKGPAIAARRGAETFTTFGAGLRP